jgi:hypothetical protein
MVSTADMSLKQYLLTELPHIVHILVTALQLMLTADVIDPDQERLPSRSWWTAASTVVEASFLVFILVVCHVEANRAVKE